VFLTHNLGLITKNGFYSFGVSKTTTVSPPRLRVSSIEDSARLIRSVTISSLS